MPFSNQFENFDPLLEHVAASPFEMLPALVTRARRLLQGRSVDEINGAARNADWMIDAFFRERSTRLTGKLERTTSLADLAILSRETRRPELTADERPRGSLGGTKDLDALEDALGAYEITDVDNFRLGRRSEYLAVLALWTSKDCLDWSSSAFAVSIRGTKGASSRNVLLEMLHGATTRDTPIRILEASRRHLLIAADLAIEVSRAVGFAEAAFIGEIMSPHVKEVEERAAELVREKISLRNREAAIASHAKDAIRRASANAWYDEHGSRYDSLNQAAKEYVFGWKEAAEEEPAIATVLGWWRAHRAAPSL